MKRGIATLGSWVAAAMVAIGCGGSPKPASQAGSPPAAGDPSTAPAQAQGGDAGAMASTSAAAVGAPGAAPVPASTASAPAALAPPPPAHPFAKNAVEATSLIDDAINARANELMHCVDDARARRKSPHERLIVEVGIDEEGHMLGVQLPKKEKQDKAFSDCVFAALQGAPFPRSHAGVITVRRTFEDKAVYR